MGETRGGCASTFFSRRVSATKLYRENTDGCTSRYQAYAADTGGPQPERKRDPVAGEGGSLVATLEAKRKKTAWLHHPHNHAQKARKTVLKYLRTPFSTTRVGLLTPTAIFQAKLAPVQHMIHPGGRRAQR